LPDFDLIRQPIPPKRASERAIKATFLNMQKRGSPNPDCTTN
jgi:hypothetical protein